jgi:hypothetical protein
MQSNVDISNVLHVLDTTTLDGNVTMNTNLLVHGDVSMQSNLEVSDTIITNSKIGIQTYDPSYSLHINTNDAILLPLGTSEQRPQTVTTGLIRYNTTTTQFEGYSNNAWQGLGGVIDIDQDTYIVAEENADEDHLRFYTDGTERMTIDACGNVGISNSTPGSNYKLDIDGNIHLSGTIVSDSDRRIKDHIQPLEGNLEQISSLQGYSYTRTDLKDKDKRHIGVIAQELERVYPELVFEHENTNIKSVNYNGLSAILIECVKELKTENNLLKQRLTVLENSIEKDKLNK